MNIKLYLIRLLACFALSFALGLERQVRRRSLGLRTMILVAIGSYLFVSFSFLVTGYDLDISRIASQVVAGIGFLGAGVILKDTEKNRVSGLTTAATLWCDAGIGILCAGGFVLEAAIASGVVLFSNIVLRIIDRLINNKIEDANISETYQLTFKIDNKEIKKFVEYLTNTIDKDENIEISQLNVDNQKVLLTIVIKKTYIFKITKLINKIVSEYNINNYEYYKISECKLEETEEL